MLRRIVIPIARLVMRILFRVEIINKDSLPGSGGYIIASNHLSFWDPVFIAAFLHKRTIYFLAKAELFRFKPFGKILSMVGAIPVNRGSKDASTIKNAVEHLKQGHVFGIFPEGTRVRKGNTASAKKGTVRIAELADVPIYPIHLKGNYRLWSKIALVIGEPIAVAQEEKMTEAELANKTSELMSTIYSL